MSDTYNITDDEPMQRARRVREASTARQTGEHYWIATTMHKVRAPGADVDQPLILDQENYRGTLVSCGLCGATNEDMDCVPQVGHHA